MCESPKKLKTNEEIASQIINDQYKLNVKLHVIKFESGKIKYVYNPLDYAREPNENYIRKYGNSTKKIIFVGMNPGPFGMCQTGVPFGDVHWTRDWLLISGEVSKPSTECPARPIKGFNFEKKEQSGHRFWGFVAELVADSEAFFSKAFVHNYCPLAFMKATGTNVTPSSLNVKERHPLEEACDEHLFNIIQILQPEIIVAVGEYVERRLKIILKEDAGRRVLRLPHPSPIVPNNQNWNEKARAFFEQNNLLEMLSVDEVQHMEKAFFFAQEALAALEVPVGCIFVYENTMIAKGGNTVNESHNATRHAEINCIDQVNEFCKEKALKVEEVFEKIDVFVTVEPCIMCAAALLELNVRKIVFGCKNDRFGGQTVFDVGAKLRKDTVVKGGYRAEEAMALLKEFYKGANPSAPACKVKSKHKRK